MSIKICKGCDKSLPVERFYIGGRYKGKTYHRSVCKDCVAQTFKKYYARNQEKIIQQVSTRYKDKSENILAYSRNYYEENRDYILVQQSFYRTTPEARAKRNHLNSKRKKAVKQSILICNDWEMKEIESLYLLAVQLTDKKKELYTVDHIHPIQGYIYGICGLHCLNNLQVVRAVENSTKQNFFIPFVSESYPCCELTQNGIQR
ncbi:hypothetical protein [Scytonema millei]|uniref:Uncharacterized protein n=1 Tax=Scytonema millei VB511283 TaxID=1245923 RepID=A0A9X5E2T8_9CYAN|nr:hypothetical protein [Scytonema millei]NHC34131.1 hypothetical protein [Scytonema millei VB511283]